MDLGDDMDLYGHLIDDSRWASAKRLGGILGAAEPVEEDSESAGDEANGA